MGVSQMDTEHTATDMGIPNDNTKDIKMESDESDESENRITIKDINNTTEMNTSQLAMQQQEND